MITDKVQVTTDIAALDSTSSDIWKQLTIIKTQAWFDTVNAIAKEYKLRAKLENRYLKSTIIYDVEGRRLVRLLFHRLFLLVHKSLHHRNPERTNQITS